jgi:RNA polymerase sigma-70 factor, ECF subfamily
VLNGVPLDALVVELGSNRNALYKTMFDARRKLRAALAAHCYLTGSRDPAGPAGTSRRS